MHHVVLERWSQGGSPLHRRDARVKIAVVCVFLVVVTTTAPERFAAFGAYGILLLLSIGLSRLPLAGMLLRAAVVLPFTLSFAFISAISGDAMRAVGLIEKSYLSALAALLLVATTPWPKLMNGLDRLGIPRLLVLVLQFLYRYLFVITEQGQHMRLAAACRGAGSARRRRSMFRGAAGAVAVLFARSYDRADGIHRAMTARGFTGRLPLLNAPATRGADWLFLLIGAAVPVALRLGIVTP